MKELWLKCRCGRNLAKVTQDAAEIAAPRGYNGYTHRGLRITARPGVEYRVHGADNPSPDRTDTYTCLCITHTGQRRVHSLTGRLVARLWDDNAARAGRVDVTLEYD
jgi:hypothetical protein